MFINKSATKLIFQHQNGEVNLFYPNTETYYHIKLVNERVDKIFWDNENAHEFIIVSGNNAYSYVISKNNIFGNVVMPMNEILTLENVANEQGEPALTKIDDNIICLSQGHVFHLGGAAINMTILTSHAFLSHYKF